MYVYIHIHIYIYIKRHAEPSPPAVEEFIHLLSLPHSPQAALARIWVRCGADEVGCQEGGEASEPPTQGTLTRELSC